MLYVYLGTDRKKARSALGARMEKLKGYARVHITDAHSVADLSAALSGGGLFGEKRAILLDGICESPELRDYFLDHLALAKDADDVFFLFEEKLDAATKRTLTKHAESLETFDPAKKALDNAIFKLRFALEKGDKKTLWVGLMHEIAGGKAPEAVHGFLFWAAKQIFLGAKTDAQKLRGRRLVAQLAELPHESRRKGIELEYALERFVLSNV
ncbi:MAG TPA: hypothetical protein VMU25_02495 [Candidatus Paceibacterota bacterium]|nr:hypothetical protein [Candidatus Paceibacterota bacterium]